MRNNLQKLQGKLSFVTYQVILLNLNTNIFTPVNECQSKSINNTLTHRFNLFSLRYE